MNNKEFYEEFKNLSKRDLDYKFLMECKKGNLDKVKYLLTSPDLKEHADIHAYDEYYDPENDDSPIPHDEALVISSFCGHFEIVQYLLTSPELKEHVNIQTNYGSALTNACYKGHLDIVKYLLISPELKEHADLHTYNNAAIYHAYQGYISGNSLETIEYMLSSPEIKKHSDIHSESDYMFRHSFSKNDEEFLKFLIFKMQIDITEDIQDCLNSRANPNVNNMFKIREMESELENELSCGIINNNQNKMKI